MSATGQKTYVVYDPRNQPYTVRIDPEFEHLIAPLRPEEYAQLEADIRERHGMLRDALTAWQDPAGPADEVVLLDGHHRLAVLAKLQAEQLAAGLTRPKIVAAIRTYGTEGMSDRDAALLWMETNQLGRRNLTDDQRAVIWGSIRERRSAIASKEGAAQARAAKADSVKSAETADTPPAVPTPAKRDTRKEVAGESGLPESKLRAVAALKKLSPEKVQEVRAGKTSLRAATKQVRAATPKLQPAPAPRTLTVQELMDWVNTGDDKGLDDFTISPRRQVAGKVHVAFGALDPATAKKLIEYYLRVRAAGANRPEVPTPEPPTPEPTVSTPKSVKAKSEYDAKHIEKFISPTEADELYARLLDLPWTSDTELRYGLSYGRGGKNSSEIAEIPLFLTALANRVAAETRVPINFIQIHRFDSETAVHPHFDPSGMTVPMITVGQERTFRFGGTIPDEYHRLPQARRPVEVHTPEREIVLRHGDLLIFNGGRTMHSMLPAAQDSRFDRHGYDWRFSVLFRWTTPAMREFGVGACKYHGHHKQYRDSVKDFQMKQANTGLFEAGGGELG